MTGPALRCLLARFQSFLRSQNIKVSGSDIGPHGGFQLGELGLCLLARFFGGLGARRTLSTQFHWED
jgi:hypothetical protein